MASVQTRGRTRQIFAGRGLDGSEQGGGGEAVVAEPWRARRSFEASPTTRRTMTSGRGREAICGPLRRRLRSRFEAHVSKRHARAPLAAGEPECLRPDGLPDLPSLLE